MALTPNLTPLDRMVLEAVQSPARAMAVARSLTPKPWEGLGRPSVEAQDRWGRAVEARLPEVEGILRGLEHLGLVKRNRGGWWVAT